MFGANKKKKTLKFDSLIDVKCTKRFMNACKNMACVCVRQRERKIMWNRSRVEKHEWWKKKEMEPKVKFKWKSGEMSLGQWCTEAIMMEIWC